MHTFPPPIHTPFCLCAVSRMQVSRVHRRHGMRVYYLTETAASTKMGLVSFHLQNGARWSMHKRTSLCCSRGLKLRASDLRRSPG